MSLFKALVFSLGASSTQVPPTEIGPFSSQSSCLEAARVILGPEVREVSSSDDSVSGIVKIRAPDSLGNKDYRFVGITVRCYEVSPVSH